MTLLPLLDRLKSTSKGESLLLLTLVLGLMSSAPSFASSPPPYHIVLDPGHGGADEGTVYHRDSVRILEKQVTLGLASATEKHLKALGYRVTLTRTSDRDLSLAARTALANRLRADLFISLHMNSAQNLPLHLPESLGPHGFETYILNHTTDGASKRLAHVENSVIANGSPHRDLDPDVDLILKDLRLDANLPSSKKLACLIQEDLSQSTSFKKELRGKNRGVKQALFHVLIGADMPSVLVEAGFLSHPTDRFRALSTQGQSEIGRSIAQAVEAFFKWRQNPKNHQTLVRCKIS